MGGATCNNCKETSHICKAAYTFGDTNDTSDVVHYKGTKDLSLEFAKKKTGVQHLCRSLMERLPFSNEQQLMPPPRGRSTAGPNRTKTQAETPVQHKFVQHKAIISNERWLERQDTPMSPPDIPSTYPPRGRRALLCGVSYKKQKCELKGSAQDVKNMRDLLLTDYNFPTESILILAEEEHYNLPTRKNIEEAFKWLTRGIRPGDSLVFYFSGHGKRQRDYNGYQYDGFDKTICPVDFQKSGMVLDSNMNEAIVRPLIKDVTLHAIMDCCHSGTVLNLPYAYKTATRKWEDNNPPGGAYRGTSGGIAICFSACQDYQLAADTSVFSPKNEMTGAMTTTFINAVKASLARNENITYQGLVDSMSHSIKQAGKSGGFFAGVRRIFHQRISQDPLLSSSEEFNTCRTFKL